jgi:hypothetical protein
MAVSAAHVCACLFVSIFAALYLCSDASLEAEDSDELQELQAEEEEEEEEEAAAAAGQLGARTEVYDEGAGSYEVRGMEVYDRHSCLRGIRQSVMVTMALQMGLC